VRASEYCGRCPCAIYCGGCPCVATGGEDDALGLLLGDRAASAVDERLLRRASVKGGPLDGRQRSGNRLALFQEAERALLQRRSRRSGSGGSCRAGPGREVRRLTEQAAPLSRDSLRLRDRLRFALRFACGFAWSGELLEQALHLAVVGPRPRRHQSMMRRVHDVAGLAVPQLLALICSRAGGPWGRRHLVDAAGQSAAGVSRTHGAAVDAELVSCTRRCTGWFLRARCRVVTSARRSKVSCCRSAAAPAASGAAASVSSAPCARGQARSAAVFHPQPRPAVTRPPRLQDAADHAVVEAGGVAHRQSSFFTARSFRG